MVNNAQTQAEEPESHSPAFSPLSIMRALWKRKIRILTVWIVFAACAIAVVRMLPPVYQAEAVVLIDSQKIPEKFVSPAVDSDVEERIASIRQLVLSSAVLRKLIDDYGLYRKERKTHVEDEVIDMMRGDITVTLDSAGVTDAKGQTSKNKRPPAFRLGYQGRDPAVVMQVANRLADLYVEENLKTRETQAAGTSQFLDTQLNDAKKHLDQMEAAVSEYKLKHNGELPEQEHSLTAALSRLQVELEANRDAINRAQQTKVVLESNLTATEAILATQTRVDERTGEPVSAGLPSPDSQEKTIATLEQQIATLSSRYKESYPDLIELRNQLARLKHAQKQEQANPTAGAPNATAAAARKSPPPQVPASPDLVRTREQIASINAQLKGLDKEFDTRKAEQQRILHDLDQYQARLQSLPIQEQQMAQITRDYEMAKADYKSLFDKKAAAEMALDMERTQQSERFVVLDRAQLPDKPIKPKRPLLYAAGAGAGLVIGLLMGFAAELKRNVMLGEWELPEGTPVLARLPYFAVPASGTAASPPGRWFRRKKQLAYAVVTPLVLGGAVALYSVLPH